LDLHIGHLKLSSFKNYKEASITFHPKFNILTGFNGMGKTNILDAVYYLCLGKSFFNAQDKFTVNHTQDFFRISGVFHEESGDQSDIVVKYASTGRKEIESEGVKFQRIGELVGLHQCVFVAPEDIIQLIDGSEDRRNFINATISQFDKSYLEALLRYHKLLKQRNAYLKSALEVRRIDKNYLETLTTAMVEPANVIFTSRMQFGSMFNPVFKELYASISGHKEDVDITYESCMQEGDISGIWYHTMDSDIRTGRTSQGIHRDDLHFLMSGHPLRHYASQGQLKSFVLALKLTQYKILEQFSGKKPILLLDDIFDKLDYQRVGHLLKLLSESFFGQILITDTEEHRVSGLLEAMHLDFCKYHVQQGEISQVN
jgi:DNA replication and repair protein RecF